MNKMLRMVAAVLTLTMLLVTSMNAFAEEIVEAPAQEITVIETPVEEAPQAEIPAVEEIVAETLVAEEVVTIIEETVTEEVKEEIASEAATEEEKTDESENVTIHVSFVGGTKVHLGDNVTVKAEINGLEDGSYTMQWQYFDGEWHDVQGANESTYTFTVNDSNITYLWRIIVDTND